jgi:hypothetical protein
MARFKRGAKVNHLEGMTQQQAESEYMYRRLEDRDNPAAAEIVAAGKLPCMVREIEIAKRGGYTFEYL